MKSLETLNRCNYLNNLNRRTVVFTRKELVVVLNVKTAQVLHMSPRTATTACACGEDRCKLNQGNAHTAQQDRLQLMEAPANSKYNL